MGVEERGRDPTVSQRENKYPTESFKREDTSRKRILAVSERSQLGGWGKEVDVGSVSEGKDPQMPRRSTRCL